MSKRDDLVSLKDMLSHACEAIELLGDANPEMLQNDRVLNLALTRLVEIIGEAANRVSKTTQLKSPAIPWDQIRGMRNRLIHGYDVVDINLLWETVVTDLPPLITELKKLI